MENQLLLVKKLHTDAILPVCAHPGSDLGYDVFSLEDVEIGIATKVKTGIVVYFQSLYKYDAYGDNIQNYGLLVRDRSSLAINGITVSGGVIDAGYKGELSIILTDHFSRAIPYRVTKGQKIAQLLPVPVMTQYGITEVSELSESERGDKGFGSTGK